MFALCIESSHQKGMGHLFRTLNFIDFLKDKNEASIVFINSDTVACGILKSKNIRFETVNLTDYENNWEAILIRKYGVQVWINDRLDTDIRHSRNVKKCGIRLVTFDDRGSGVDFADIQVAALAFTNEEGLKGKKILSGLDYLILNKDIIKFRRLRKKIEKIIVTLGGSDTHGVTVKVTEILTKLNKKATIHLGPSFRHRMELDAVVNKDFCALNQVPSLIEAFYEYDLAITGGGITPFEANASGLPCIIIANEIFEIPNGRFLNELGSSVFAGYHEDINIDFFKMELNIEKMSMVGMHAITLHGAENVYRQILEL